MIRPLWGRAVYTAVHGARLSSVPSGDRSANPATHSVSGRSDLQRAHISISSAWKRSGAEMLATLSGVSRAASTQGTELAALSIPETSLGGGLLWGQSIPILGSSPQNGHCRRCRPPLAAESFRGLRSPELR